MKNIIIAIGSIVLMSASCKPEIPVVPEDLLVQLLTDGEWSVTEYKLNGVDKTPEFAGWRVKFYSGKTADAKFNTVVMTSGTWDASQSAQTFNINFPTAGAPMNQSNGTWHVDQPGTRIVVSSQISGTDVKTMKLYRE